MMKRKSLFVVGIALVSIVSFQFTSCNKNEQEEIYHIGSDNILEKYGSIHNSGLDYILNDAEKNPENYNANRLDSIFFEWVVSQYGIELAKNSINKMGNINELVFTNMEAALLKSRSDTENDFGVSEKFAMQAIAECIDEIKPKLLNLKDDEMFDNLVVSEELQLTISKIYNNRLLDCTSESDKETLSRVLGVLHGSIDYWTKSSNAYSWSRINLNDTDISGSDKSEWSLVLPSQNKPTELTDTLSKSDWIMTVAAADAIGAVFGGPHGAVIASAAAALYFDVE